MTRSEYDEHGCRTGGPDPYNWGDEDRPAGQPTPAEIATAADAERGTAMARIRGVNHGGQHGPAIRVCGNGQRRRGKGRSVNG